MPLYNSPQAYVFNLQTTSSAEAKRMWRRKIKEEWDLKCAYCGSEEELTIAQPIVSTIDIDVHLNTHRVKLCVISLFL